MSSQWRAMVEVRFRDLVIISFILGVMALTMSTMLAYFSTGMQDNPMGSVRVGIFCGCVVTGLTLMYGGWRLIEIKRGDNKTEKVNVLDELKSFLSPVEAHASSLFWADERPWRTSTHVKVDRGTLTLDLHDLDVIGAKRALDVVIENRPIIGRIRIVTGRGKNSRGNSVIRPMVVERLNKVAHALDWQILGKAGSITLRPLGKRPTFKLWLFRFIIFVGPFTIALALSFEELAGSAAREQGRTFGAAAGLIMTSLLASYRDRASY